MKANRRKTLCVLPTTGDKKIEVEVVYSTGGYSYYDYKNHPRGYWLHVRPIEFTDSGFVTFVFGDGRKFFVSEANRFGAKAFDRAVEKARGMVDDAVEKICHMNGLTLAPVGDE